MSAAAIMEPEAPHVKPDPEYLQVLLNDYPGIDPGLAEKAARASAELSEQYAWRNEARRAALAALAFNPTLTQLVQEAFDAEDDGVEPFLYDHAVDERVAIEEWKHRKEREEVRQFWQDRVAQLNAELQELRAWHAALTPEQKQRAQERVELARSRAAEEQERQRRAEWEQRDRELQRMIDANEARKNAPADIARALTVISERLSQAPARSPNSKQRRKLV